MRLELSNPNAHISSQGLQGDCRGDRRVGTAGAPTCEAKWPPGKRTPLWTPGQQPRSHHSGRVAWPIEATNNDALFGVSASEAARKKIIPCQLSMNGVDTFARGGNHGNGGWMGSTASRDVARVLWLCLVVSEPVVGLRWSTAPPLGSAPVASARGHPPIGGCPGHSASDCCRPSRFVRVGCASFRPYYNLRSARGGDCRVYSWGLIDDR